MRIALLQHPWQLTFRGKWDWSDIYNDPRGMSGSELGFVEIARGLHAMGHDVHMFTDSDVHVFARGLGVLPWNFHADKWKGGFDLAIAINHPGGLEHFDCPKVCINWLNSFEFLCKAEVGLVDHWVSPSETHRNHILGMSHALGDGSVAFSPDQWSVVPLGCDPGAYDSFTKVPGRVVYTSSPDRGLHHLLHVWPRIKRAVPHAELEIYYRLRPWIDELLAVPEPFDPIEENRQRALYVNEALRRLEGDKWGVRVMGPVSRNRIARAIGEAECFAYPCSTMRFSEGFSCSTLEACAAGACPIIWDCDALGRTYAGAAEVVELGDEGKFTESVVRALTDDQFREGVNVRCKKFASKITWAHVCQVLLEAALRARRSSDDLFESQSSFTQHLSGDSSARSQSETVAGTGTTSSASETTG